MNKYLISDKKGFTLIELLVVIAIIGLLSSVVLASLSSARAKARDAQRISSIKQVQNALELYYAQNNVYPAMGGLSTLKSALTTPLVPTHISTIPLDPVGQDTQSGYRYYSDVGPNIFYAISLPMEGRAHCYVCGGPQNLCNPGLQYYSSWMC